MIIFDDPIMIDDNAQKREISIKKIKKIYKNIIKSGVKFYTYPTKFKKHDIYSEFKKHDIYSEINKEKDHA